MRHPITSDCVCCYRCGEGAAAAAMLDVGPNAYHLNGLWGTAPPVAGKYGGARQITPPLPAGLGGCVFRTPVIGTALDLTQVSVGAWFEITRTDGWPTCHIAGRGIFNGGQNYSYGLHLIGHSGHYHPYGEVSLNNGTGYGVQVTPQDAAEMGLGVHHAMVTFNGANAILYVDGLPVDSHADARPLYYRVDAQRLYAGAGWSVGGPFWSLPGNLDDWAIYNTAWTPAQISDLYNLGNLFVVPVDPLSAAVGVAADTTITLTLTSEDSTIVPGWTVEVYRNGAWEMAYQDGGSPAYKAGWQGPGAGVAKIPWGYELALDPHPARFASVEVVQVRVTATDAAGYGVRLGVSTDRPRLHDAIVVTDSVDVHKATGVSVRDLVDHSDDAFTNLEYLRRRADTVVVSDSVRREAVKLRAVADLAVAVTDSVAVEIYRGGSVDDVIAVTDQVTRGVTFERSVADTVVAVDAVTEASAYTFGRDVADTVAVSDAVAVEMVYGREVDDTVAATDKTRSSGGGWGGGFWGSTVWRG